MNTIKWAENEIRIVIDKMQANARYDDGDFLLNSYDYASELFETLIENNEIIPDVVIDILNNLIKHKCLSEINDTDDIWTDCGFNYDDDKQHTYQCKRLPSLFKDVYPDGQIKYSDMNRVTFIDSSCECTRWHNGLCDTIVDELFPLLMPYTPKEGKYMVYGRTCTTLEDGTEDHVIGTYNTTYIDYMMTPEGEKIELNRKYIESENGNKRVI